MTQASLRRLSIAATLACCVYLLALQVSIGYPYHYAGLFSDGISYLYMADILSGKDPAANAIAVLHWRHSQFPPGYPAILAAIGAGSGHPERGLLLQAAIAILIASALAAYFRRASGSLQVALLLLLPCLLMPWHLPWTLEISSEPLFLLLLLGMLLISQSKLPDPRKLLSLALICGLLCLVRNAGVPMILALVAWGLLRRLGILRIAAAALLATGPMLAWMLFKQTQQVRASYGDTLPMLLERLASEPLALAADQAHAFLLGLTFTQTHGTPALIVPAVMIVLALPSIWRRCRRGELDALFLALYLPLAMIWPYPAESSRLLGVVQPLLLLQVWLTLRWLVERRAAPIAISSATLLSLGLALLSPGWSATLARAHQHAADATLERYRRSAGWFLSDAPDAFAESVHRLILLARQSTHIVPPDACIYATMPSLVSLHSQRMAWRTPTQVVSADGTPSAIRCAYFMVTTTASLQGTAAPLHPLGNDAGKLRPIITSQRVAGDMRTLEAALLEWPSAAPGAAAVPGGSRGD